MVCETHPKVMPRWNRPMRKGRDDPDGLSLQASTSFEDRHEDLQHGSPADVRPCMLPHLRSSDSRGIVVWMTGFHWPQVVCYGDSFRIAQKGAGSGNRKESETPPRGVFVL